MGAAVGLRGAALAAAAAETKAFGNSTSGAGKEIDKLSGRLRLMTDLALIGERLGFGRDSFVPAIACPLRTLG